MSYLVDHISCVSLDFATIIECAVHSAKKGKINFHKFIKFSGDLKHMSSLNLEPGVNISKGSVWEGLRSNKFSSKKVIQT